jgi:hypothetical protein
LAFLPFLADRCLSLSVTDDFLLIRVCNKI